MDMIQQKNASILKRMMAFGIDLYLGALLASLPISILSLITLQEISQNIFLMTMPVASLSLILSILCIIFYYYYIPYKIFPNQTIGKRLLNIKIDFKDKNVKKVLWKRQLLGMVIVEGAFTSGGKLLYQFISILCGYNLVQFLGNITSSISLISIGLLIFNKQHRMLHDMIAQSDVVEL